MGRHSVEFKKERVVELYNKYGSITRTALSLNCSVSTLRKFLIENEIDIKQYSAPRFNVNAESTKKYQSKGKL